MQNKLSLFLKGVAMGIAEVIPGVSGGTIAFITGIYETLIKSIKSFGLPLLGEWKRGGLKAVFQRVNGGFLSVLLLGMASGLLIGIFLISHLLHSYPEPLWAFFFGLILASSLFVYKKIENKSPIIALYLILGAIAAFSITQLGPAEGSLHPFMVVFSAFVAISALMLPGISGSFILLLLGMYALILTSVKNFILYRGLDDLLVIVYFGIGGLLGLYIFSRVLTWLFSKYKQIAYAILTGFMIGALPKIWPWRNPVSIILKESGEILNVNDIESYRALSQDEYRIISETLVVPSHYFGQDPRILACVLAMFIGLFLIFAFERYNSINK